MNIIKTINDIDKLRSLLKEPKFDKSYFNLEEFYSEDQDVIKEFMLSVFTNKTFSLEPYSNIDSLGKYYLLANSLIAYTNGDEKDIYFDDDTQEWIAECVLLTLRNIFWRTDSVAIGLRDYVDDLIGLLCYYNNESVLHYADLFQDTSFNTLDENQLRNNFLGFKLFRKNYIFMFYLGLINANVISPLRNWRDLKHVITHLPNITSNDARILYDFNSLEDYQVEFLLEFGFDDKELFKYALMKNLRIPQEMKSDIEEIKLVTSVEHITSIDEAIQIWPDLDKAQREYVYNKLKEYKYVKLGLLPIFMYEIDMKFYDAGITDFPIVFNWLDNC